MAEIKNLKLIVEKNRNDNQGFAQVRFDVEFSEQDIRYTNGFKYACLLYHTDGTPDEVLFNLFSPLQSPQVIKIPGKTDQNDHLIGIIASGIIDPLDRSEHIVRSQEWNFGRFNTLKETFRVVVYITPNVPEINGHGAFSEEVKSGLR